MTDAGIRVRRTPPPELGPMLAAARLRAGYRGRECARLVGIDHSYLIRLESGQRVPSTTVAHALIQTLALDSEASATLLAAAVEGVGRGHPWKARSGVA